MIRHLYKYTTLRLDFFEEPMIRATPAAALNDPFEGCFNKSQVLDANRNHEEHYRNKGKEVYTLEDSEVDGIMEVIEGDLSDLGIISFTEDYTNPLMWAHYGDEHKGVVVEFDYNVPFFADSLQEVDGRKSRFGRNYFGATYEIPQKVMYRREMPSFKRAELVNPDHEDEFHWKKFNESILFTKAIDWIYEKEHRIIVQLQDADSIICMENPYIRKVCARDESIKLESFGKEKIKITYPREYEMHEKMGDQSIKSEIHMLTLGDEHPAIHLFRINPLAICGVYFGCKSDHYKVLTNMKNSHNLAHVKNLYKMRINRHLYQLDLEKIA